jgi:PAS domain S-box-containing protein
LEALPQTPLRLTMDNPLRFLLLCGGQIPAEVPERLRTLQALGGRSVVLIVEEEEPPPGGEFGEFDLALVSGAPEEALARVRRLREVTPTPPIVVLLPAPDEAWMGRLHRAGATECVSPARHDHLEGILLAALAGDPVSGPDGITAANPANEAHLRAALKEVSRLKHVLDQHVIVATTDQHGRITSANDKFCQLSGYRRDELIGQDHRILNSGTHPKDYFRELWATILRGEVWRGEIRNRAKNGTLYWVDTVIIPQFQGDSGKPDEFIAIRTDITRLKALENNLEQARDEAMEASRLKSEFLANMSHEIRTPMNGIIGMSGLLLEMELDEEQRHMAGIVQSSAENLLTIINDILDFSRIEAGKMRLDFADFELGHLIEDTLEILRPTAHEKELAIVGNLPRNLPGHLQGDPGRIRQVLTNLVGNALKFTDEGAVIVSLRVLAEADDALRFRISVQDTGCGIAPEDQAGLFEPFVQVDGSITRRHGGTGLGLAIASQLVELMGGTIGLRSSPGQGSTFWFELELPKRPVRSETARRVLIVDDNPDNREILLRQLANHGVWTEAVADARAALACLASTSREEAWDLVLLDHQMPEISGLELAQAIRSDPNLAEIPLIMLSSAGATMAIEDALGLGFSAILTKPVRKEQLHRLLLGSFSGQKDEERQDASPPQVQPMKLLLAEDHPANRAVARTMLTRMGHRVTTVADGAQALLRLSRETFDAVLMDCQMPVLDGYEATRRIRGGALAGIDPQVPIIALTAHALPQDRIKCLEAGMDGYLTKPIRPSQLEAALTRCFQGAALRALQTLNPDPGFGEEPR